MTSLNSLNTRKELEKYERISSSCSKKYVPIFSTKLVESLEPEFKYLGVQPYSRTGNNGSRHYITMKKNDSIELRIENSFDRTLALRISFVYKNFVFGFVRQVHIGQNALSISQTNEISDIYKKATDYVQKLTSIKFTKIEQMQIIQIAAKERGISIARLSNPTQYLNEDLNAMEFIENVLEMVYNRGVEYISTKTDSTKLSKPMNNDFTKMKVSKKVYSFLDKVYPELSL